MRWIVRVARTMDDVKECYFTDKNEALKYVEALKKLTRAVGAAVWMEEISDDEQRRSSTKTSNSRATFNSPR